MSSHGKTLSFEGSGYPFCFVHVHFAQGLEKCAFFASTLGSKVLHAASQTRDTARCWHVGSHYGSRVQCTSHVPAQNSRLAASPTQLVRGWVHYGASRPQVPPPSFPSCSRPSAASPAGSPSMQRRKHPAGRGRPARPPSLASWLHPPPLTTMGEHGRVPGGRLGLFGHCGVQRGRHREGGHLVLHHQLLPPTARAEKRVLGMGAGPSSRRAGTVTRHGAVVCGVPRDGRRGSRRSESRRGHTAAGRPTPPAASRHRAATGHPR